MLTEKHSCINHVRQETVNNHNFEPNWLNHWSKQDLKEMQFKDAAISEMLRRKQNFSI
jgi:hypothetical protein